MGNNLPKPLYVVDLRPGHRFEQYSGTVATCLTCERLFIGRDDAKFCKPGCGNTYRARQARQGEKQ